MRSGRVSFSPTGMVMWSYPQILLSPVEKNFTRHRTSVLREATVGRKTVDAVMPRHQDHSLWRPGLKWVFRTVRSLHSSLQVVSCGAMVFSECIIAPIRGTAQPGVALKSLFLQARIFSGTMRSGAWSPALPSC